MSKLLSGPVGPVTGIAYAIGMALQWMAVAPGHAQPLAAMPLPQPAAGWEANNHVVVTLQAGHTAQARSGTVLVPVALNVRDASGASLSGRAEVSLQAGGVRWHDTPDARWSETSATGEHTVVLVDGRATVWGEVLRGVTAVDVQVTWQEHTILQRLVLPSPIDEALAVGLVEGIVHMDRSRPSVGAGSRAMDDFEAQIRSWSIASGDGRRSAALRTAFFVRRPVGDGGGLTVAYDSDKPSSGRLFQDVDPERWYPVYGDDGQIGFDARANSRLYARLERGRSFVMYGDIVTGDGFSQREGQGWVASSRIRDLGSYNRSMTGLRAHAEGARGHADVFVSRDNLRRVVEEFPGRGLSGPYTVTNATHAVLGSERVELIVRDRHAPSRIVSSSAMTRFVDYTFEPFSGRILFNAAIPTVDEALNPVSVRVTYEVEQGGEAFWLYGVQAQYRVTDSLEVGGNYVSDENPLSPFRLGSSNVTWRLGERGWLRAEHARTESAANSAGGNIYTLVPDASGSRIRGDAFRVEVGYRSARTSALAWWGQSDSGFNNPAASFLGGREQAGFLLDSTMQTAARRRIVAYAKGDWVSDRTSGASRTQVDAGFRYTPVTRLQLSAGIRHVDEEAGDQRAGNPFSTVGALAAPYGVGVVSPGLGGGFGGGAYSLLPATGQTLFNTGSGWSTQYGSWVGNGLAGTYQTYSALTLNGVWQVSERIDVAGEVERAVDDSAFSRAALGAGWRMRHGDRLYGRYEWNTGLGVSASSSTPPGRYESDAFVMGAERVFGVGGALFSEYRLHDAAGQAAAQWSNGVRHRWSPSANVVLAGNAEKLRMLQGAGEEADAIALSMDWRADSRWVANARLEWRRSRAHDDGVVTVLSRDDGLPSSAYNTSMTSWLSTLTASRVVSENVRWIVRNHHLRNHYTRTNAQGYENRLQTGLSYRDNRHNRLNVLARYEYWARRDQTTAGLVGEHAGLMVPDGYDKHIVAAHADWHPRPGQWWSGRIASKRQSDLYGTGRTRYDAHLAGGRITFDLGSRWDVSAGAFRMWTNGGGRHTAVGAEVGMRLRTNLWLSGGYNVSGFVEDDLAMNEYTRKGVYIRLRFKFDENLLSTARRGEQ